MYERAKQKLEKNAYEEPGGPKLGQQLTRMNRQRTKRVTNTSVQVLLPIRSSLQCEQIGDDDGGVGYKTRNLWRSVTRVAGDEGHELLSRCQRKYEFVRSLSRSTVDILDHCRGYFRISCYESKILVQLNHGYAQCVQFFCAVKAICVS